jgi:ABC-type sugar transport system ATPase subunit
VAGLTLERVTKRFLSRGAGTAAVDGVDLLVADGEFLAVLGPSGSGKTTLLRLIAGLEPVDAGTIRLGPTTVSAPGLHVPPERRRVGVVFQSYALWPHMTVKRNVGYALEVRRVRGATYDRRVAAALATVGLGGFEGRRPAELSGGQRQRVALARCLAMEPSVVLLDEPLASLDVHLRAALQEEFTAFHRHTGATMLYVTHDQAEAMALANRVAVMDSGRIVQYAPPLDLYRRPATTFVADFIGNPPMNLIPAEAHREDGKLLVRAEGLTVSPLPFTDALAQALTHGPALTIGIRPEHLSIGQADRADRIDGLPFANENMGPESLVTIVIADERRVTARLFTDEHVKLGERVALTFKPADLTLFDARGVRIANDLPADA